jgi:hypothetical protein
LAFDIDEAGRTGIEKTEQRIGKEVEVLVLKYPFKDPSLMFERWGTNKMADHFNREMAKIGL